MAKKSKKKESEPKNEVITNCDNQQFAVANSCLGKRPIGPSGDLKNINIESLIRTIRGQKVMVDFDLAMLYGVKTKALNQSVKRNIKRFPDDFMFQLTKEEWDVLRSQIVTTKQYVTSCQVRCDFGVLYYSVTTLQARWLGQCSTYD